jgi:hypothetical protein
MLNGCLIQPYYIRHLVRMQFNFIQKAGAGRKVEIKIIGPPIAQNRSLVRCFLF